MPATPLINQTSVYTGTGSSIWYNWVSEPFTGSPATTIAFTSSTGTATFNSIWNNWLSPTSAIISTPYLNQNRVVSSQPVITPQQFAQQRQQARSDAKRMARRQRDARRVVKRAETKAETLLLKHLDYAQRVNWMTKKFVEIKVGNRNYRIKKGSIGNVELFDERGVVARLCVHPTNAYELPPADIVMAQMMMLKFDEANLLKMANIHWNRSDVSASDVRMAA